jgi:hypothetical protein
MNHFAGERLVARYDITPKKGMSKDKETIRHA